MYIMKNSSLCFGFFSVVLASTFSSAVSAAEKQGFYITADLGPAMTEDTSLREFPEAVGGGDVEFDTGVRFGFGGGYRACEWFSVGGETGYIFHGIEHTDGFFSQVPILANIEFRLPNRSPIVPFVGGGPGVAISGIGFDHDTLDNGATIDGYSSDVVFAWQVYGGLRVKLNEEMSIGAAYRYFDAEAPEWDIEHSSQNVRFGRMKTHAVTAAFFMSF